uniref:N-acetyltransferase domain-containing protein n=1 Tax=Heterosigma akashiwo TaxID=2829 RepID=A0A6V1NRK6_HETAK|mmetsp:Transcript_2884/g.4686  ORF Transcript_2884/g.4686 Transcript_2884/m.4686 type:complete len:258 (+) Transcript_2884:64-837(+)
MARTGLFTALLLFVLCHVLPGHGFHVPLDRNVLQQNCLCSGKKVLKHQRWMGASGDGPGSGVLSLEDIEAFAERQDLYLSVSTMGPLFRVVARDGEETILAYADGFTAGKFMHLDTLRVVRTRRKENATITKDMVTSLPGLLNAYVLGHARAQGCETVECLAIYDDERTHRKLVRAYQRIGYTKLREVEDGLGSFFDLIQWGGVGTLMTLNPEEYLKKWYGKIKGGAEEVAAANDNSSNVDEDGETGDLSDVFVSSS